MGNVGKIYHTLSVLDCFFHDDQVRGVFFWGGLAALSPWSLFLYIGIERVFMYSLH